MEAMMRRFEVLRYLESEYLPRALDVWDPDALTPPSWWEREQDDLAACYLQDGIQIEYGKVCAIYKDLVKNGVSIDREALVLGLGDLIWYCTITLFTVDDYASASSAMFHIGKLMWMADANGIELGEICERSLAKGVSP